MDTIPTGNPTRWTTGTASATGGGAPTVTAVPLLDATNTAPPNGTTFWLTGYVIWAKNTGTTDLLSELDLVDGAANPNVRVREQVRSSSTTAADLTTGLYRVGRELEVAIPFQPLDNTHTNAINVSHNIANTITFTISVNGFWTTTPPQDFPIAGPIS